MLINGERISGGENGPEAMLGTLVRVILDQVQQMRQRYLENIPLNSSRRKIVSFADLDESQALSCARDILLSCNRTESGGDTYLAIQSLLINKDYAVLTPFASSEEPLEIIVDIVESKQQRSIHTETNPSADLTHRNYDRAYSGDISTPPTELKLSKRVTDDYTDSSGLTFSVSTNEEENLNHSRFSQYHDQLGMINYIESSDLSMPSDIDGATAIKSSVLQSKNIKRRNKDLSRFKLFQGSGSISDSSNFSDNSSAHIDDFIPDTSLEETSESAEDIDPILGHSFDSNDSPPDKPYLSLSPTLARMTEDDELLGRFENPTSNSRHCLISPAEVHSPHPDDVTLDLSEVTMDSALMAKGEKSGTFSKAIRFVSPTTAKPKGEKGLLSQILKRTEGRHKNSGESERNLHPKKQTTFSGIRKAFRPEKEASSGDLEEDQDINPAAQSMCIRIQMIAKSKYRLCNLDPQNESEDNWAVVHGGFHQVFFLKSNSNGRPSMSDRLVTIKVASGRR
jgi:hypothetical protein